MGKGGGGVGKDNRNQATAIYTVVQFWPFLCHATLGRESPSPKSTELRDKESSRTGL